MNPSRRVALVAAIYLGTFIASLDISIVNLALPTLQYALDTDLAGLQWVVDAYALCLSAFMLSSGPLSDRYGRKLTWLLGVGLFSFGSLLCALATSLALLLFGRAVQGIAGALLIPGALSILTQAFHDPGQRAQVIGGWTSFSALSLILGPLLGGLLVEHAGWQSIFLINLPLGLLALALGLWGIEETAHPEHAAFDPLGQLLSVVWLGALTYALIAAGEGGWLSPTAWPALLLAGVGLLGFLFVERRTARPLLPLGLFRQAGFAVCNLASFVLGFSGYASLFFLSLFFQQVQGASAQQAGFYLAPQFLAMGALSMLFGRLQRRTAATPAGAGLPGDRPGHAGAGRLRYGNRVSLGRPVAGGARPGHGPGRSRHRSGGHGERGPRAFRDGLGDHEYPAPGRHGRRHRVAGSAAERAGDRRPGRSAGGAGDCRCATARHPGDHGPSLAWFPGGARRRAAGRAGRGLPSGYAGGRSQRPAGRRAALAPAR